jgi:hypothetical protein
MVFQNTIGINVLGAVTDNGDGTYVGNIGTSGQVIQGVTGNQLGGFAFAARGDIVTSAGSGGAVLSLGTDGQALIADAASTNGIKWTAGPAGSVETFLSAQTASASSSLDFTSSIDSTYLLYQFTLDHLIFSTASMQLGVQFSTDGGSSWITTGYLYGSNGVDGGGLTHANSTSDTSILLPYTTMSATANKTCTGLVYLIGPSVSKYPMICWNGGFFNGSTFSPMTGAGVNGSAAAINGVRFIPTSGTITSGVIYMHGAGKPS